MKSERKKSVPEQDLIKKIEALDYVVAVREWQSGRRYRLYIDTCKFNGGKNWNGGVGYTLLYVEGGVLFADGVAGARTERALCDTLEQIQDFAENS